MLLPLYIGNFPAFLLYSLFHMHSTFDSLNKSIVDPCTMAEVKGILIHKPLKIQVWASWVAQLVKNMPAM